MDGLDAVHREQNDPGTAVSTQQRRPYVTPTLESSRTVLLDLACVSCTAGNPDCPCDGDTTPV